jgi:isopentenyl-diphosphate delta-isomerase
VITTRKEEHLDLCVKRDVSASGAAGWDDVILPHSALPDVDFSEIVLETEFLGAKFSAPILISSMTGGSEHGEEINKVLARFAQHAKIPMGVGSQRIALESKDPSLFALRKIAPDAVLYANIGAVQLNYGVSIEDCQFLVDKLQAQALILHLNPLQEAIQKEGDRNFKGLWQKISALCKVIKQPVILKETGCGLDVQTCIRAREAGVAAVDVAGFGGTHWGYIEGLRSTDREQIGNTFRSWGIPTVTSLIQARSAMGDDFPIIASGGVRSGVDVAKALFLGANMTGMAMPFLKAAEGGDEKLNEFYTSICEVMRIALFCTDSVNVAKLQGKGPRFTYENESH